MRRSVMVLSACVLAVLASGCSDTGSGEDCVGAELTASQSTVAPGDELALTGAYFLTGCHDTGEAAPEQDATSAPVLWSQGMREGAQLGEAAIDTRGELTATVTVPDDAAAGEATVSVSLGAGTTAELTLTVAP
ncbi:hypothetical protein [Cellulomonas gilvus]|uniref:Uncharacterized protein n=1 Tax=Cellulomonas gilvus (strain ATCC 13127 / NRRL B-14078) TaxID=593907 RepID=F8A2J1_CELGA|nr:hypothetical protein [Cellulomonas gilvus]AEI12984.1 hypothetical protein Celgi_2485 [Cellulomonas gilvus ATCC 13127]